MSEYFHGTSYETALEIRRSGLAAGAYVATDFDLAASYALKHGAPAIVVLSGQVAPPAERAYDTEAVAMQMQVLRVLRPCFREIPEDYYELNDKLTGRKYPQLFARQNWQ